MMWELEEQVLKWKNSTLKWKGHKKVKAYFKNESVKINHMKTQESSQNCASL